MKLLISKFHKRFRIHFWNELVDIFFYAGKYTIDFSIHFNRSQFGFNLTLLQHISRREGNHILLDIEWWGGKGYASKVALADGVEIRTFEEGEVFPPLYYRGHFG